MNRFLPFLSWIRDTDARSLRADLVGGVTVALVLIPQSMAYAQLAGLPAYYGLYASFLPPVVASLFGSSRQLATGPVAIVSLMTAATLEPLATAGSAQFIAYAVFLALLVGVIQLLLGVLRLGILVNFLSHPVVTGFTNAGALIIASSQLSRLLGVEVDKGEHHYETVAAVVREAFRHGHLPTIAFGAGALVLMIVLRRISRRIPCVLVAAGLAILLARTLGFERETRISADDLLTQSAREMIESFNVVVQGREEALDELRRVEAELSATESEKSRFSAEVVQLEARAALIRIERRKAAERASELRGRLRRLRFVRAEGPGGETGWFVAGKVPGGWRAGSRRWRLRVGNRCLSEGALCLSSGGSVVGRIPRGLPPFALPAVDLGLLPRLFTGAVIIALLGFMEAISIAKAMAARTGQRLDPNQELIGQGLGCIAGSLSGSYPVSGSFSRSAVNLQAGAASGLSMIFASGVVAVTLLFLTPLLYFLPQSVLAAVIMLAVIGLVKPASFVHAFRVHHHDGITAVATFAGTLVFAPHLDRGIALGVGLSLVFYLSRNMKPAVATLAKHPDGSFRSCRRWGLAECRYISPIRFHGSLIFANATYLEDQVLQQLEDHPDLRHVLLVANGINEIDSSGEEVLALLVTRLREGGREVSISGLNDRMVDLLRRTGLLARIGEENLYRNVREALASIHARAHAGGDERRCPLLEVVRKE